jgi:acetyl-CoA C-acetyltransferase
MNGEIVVLSGVRTAIGGYGGSLKDSPPSDMAATCVREAVARSGIDAKDVLEYKMSWLRFAKRFRN